MQRVAIARPVALEADAMLLDDPTTARDPELGLEVPSVMRDLATQGTTMIALTHEMNFIY